MYSYFPNKFLKIALIVLISFSLLSFLNFSLVIPVSASNASLYLSPSQGNYFVGDEFSIQVKLDTHNEPVNAGEGVISFNPYELEVVKVSQDNSIFSIWTTKPSFSNSSGKIFFGGGRHQSFRGNFGTVITITFRAKAVCSTKVKFLSASVLAADGQGTNILAEMKGGVYKIKTKEVIPPSKQVPAEEVSPKVPSEKGYFPLSASSKAPPIPVIYSKTHSPGKWSNNNQPEFYWPLPAGVEAVKISVDKNPNSLPSILYQPAITEKKLDKLEDGEWYFHIRFKNIYGCGGILHRQILIDTQPPKPFKIKVEERKDLTDPSPLLSFKSEDSLSGLDYYRVRIFGQKVLSVSPLVLEGKPYKIPPLKPGEHLIIVEAVDKAGNSSVALTELKIKPLKAPIIKEAPHLLKKGEPLIVRGSSDYPQSDLLLFIKKPDGSIESGEVITSEKGNWIYIHPHKLEEGVYQIWAQVIDKRGAQSELTKKITLAVRPSFISRIGRKLVDYLSFIVTLVLIIIFFVFLILYGWHWILLPERRKLGKDISRRERKVRDALRFFSKGISREVDLLREKKNLTLREKEVYQKLKRLLNMSKDFLREEENKR